MGLSASQARFLMLTAKQNNIEFQIQRLTQEKLNITNALDNEATLWSNGMNIKHLYYSPGGNGSVGEDLPRLSYAIVTGSAEKGGLGMSVRDSFGRTIVSELPDPIPEGKTAADYAVEPYCYQADYFENNLKTGNWFIQSIDDNGNISDVSISGANFIYEGTDESDYAICNAAYEEKVKRLQRIDKKLDMEIKTLDGQREAAIQEKESLRKIIDKNIEGSFKSFG